MKKFIWMYDKMGMPKPVVIDGGLYVLIAFCAYNEATLKGDDSYKYMAAWLVFFLKWLFGAVGGTALALKMFRDKSYSDHRASVDAKASLNLPDSTQVITQQQTTKVETTQNEKTNPSNP